MSPNLYLGGEEQNPETQEVSTDGQGHKRLGSKRIASIPPLAKGRHHREAVTS